MNFFFGCCVAIAIIIGGIVVTGAIGIPVTYAIEAPACASKAAKMEMPHSYGLFQGCMVQDKHGRWWPIERYSHITVNADEE